MHFVSKNQFFGVISCTAVRIFVVTSDSALTEFVLGRLSLPDCLPFRSQKSIGFFTSPNLRSLNCASNKNFASKI